MKRIIPLISVLVFIASLNGCSQSKKEIQIKTLNESFILTADGDEYVGDVYFDRGKPMSIKLEKPSELEGITLTVRPEGVSVACDTVSFDVPSALEASPFNRLYGIFAAMSSETITVDREGLCETEIEHSGKKYISLINCESERVSDIVGDDFHIEFNGT